MKRFTLFAIAALLSVVAFAQKPVASVNALDLSKGTPIAMDWSLMTKASRDLAVKAHKAKAPRKAVAAASDIEKGYVWNYQTSNQTATDVSTIETEPGTDNVLIKVTDEATNTVNIYNGLFNTLTATVDLENQLVVIPVQVAYTHSTYGDCNLRSIFYYEGDDTYEAGWYYDDALYGDIQEDGSIYFDDWFYLLIVSGQYANYRLGSYYVSGSTMEVDPTINAMMEVVNNASYGDGATEVIPVSVTREGSVVSVKNFAGFGETATINLNADETLTIPHQVVWIGGDTYGDFSTYAADYSIQAQNVSDFIVGEEINGTYTDTELSWGNWLLYSTTNYWTGAKESAKITLIDGSSFKDDGDKIASPWVGAEAAEGDFYLYNPESGLWLQNNNMHKVWAWTTRAEVDVDGLPFGLVPVDGGLRINPYFSGNHSLNASNLYMDTPDAVTTWVFTPSDRVKNGYTITAGDKALGVDENGNVSDVIVGVWQLVTKEERVAALAKATADAPVNATWLIEANSFPANYEKNAEWQRTGDAGGFNIGGDWWENPNRVLETWALSEADVFQEIEVPNGVYELQAAGAYSPTPGNEMNADDLNAYIAGTLPNYGWFYANGEYTQMPSIYSEYRTESTPDRATRSMGSYWVPDGVNQVSRGMTDGLYKSDIVKVVVTDGKLRVGAKVFGATTKKNWIIIDNFRLTYYGDSEEAAEEDYTVDPIEGKVTTLSTVTVTFDNGIVVEGEPKATLLNVKTGEQLLAPITTLGSTSVTVDFGEEVASGTYQVIFPAGAIRNTNENTLMPAMGFDYTVWDPYELVTPPADLETELWTVGGAFQVGSFNEWSATNFQYEPNDLAKTIKVGFDGDDVYFQGLGWFNFLKDGWAKGTITGEVKNDMTLPNGEVVEGTTYKTITFPGVQYQGNVDGKDYWLLVTDLSTGLYQYPDEVTLLYDEENGAIWPAKNNTLISVNGKYDKFLSYGYYQDYIIRQGGEEEPAITIGNEIVEVPEGVETEEYLFTGFDKYNEETTSRPIEIAFDGNDVYINGLSEIIPEAFVKGTIDGNTITVAGGQYLGIYYYYGFYPFDMYFDVKKDVVFNYDAAAKKLTCAAGYDTYYYSEPGEDEEDDGFYLFDEYEDVTITKVIEKAATPADPIISEVKATTYGDVLLFTIPTVDTNGEPMVSSKITFRVFSNISGTEAPVTFEADEDLYPYLEEDMTDIPYGFTEDYDFYPTAIYLNLDHADWDMVGMQSTYTGGGESHSSNIVWLEINQNANPTGISEVNSDNAKAKVFNLQGVELQKLQRGINIVGGKKLIVR